MKYDKQWYDSLDKPEFQPPDRVFMPVWTVLYILMAIALFVVVQDGFEFKNILAALLFFIQLSVNLSWPRAFFAEKNLRKAFLLTVLLTFLVLLTMIVFFMVEKLAGILMLPYFLWCCFATVLSFEILELNEW